MCRWPGRNQIIQRREVTYYLDGAHTPASMNCVAEWFKDMTSSDGRCPMLKNKVTFFVVYLRW